MPRLFGGIRTFRFFLREGIKVREIISPTYQEMDFPRLFGALLEVLTPAGVQGSNSELFKGAIFGRDSLRVALDLLDWYPVIAERVIFSLARLQGTECDLVSEEEPGKIPHEYRHLFLGDRKIEPNQIRIMKEIAKRWGWSKPEEEICYFGSVDATPQFIRLITKYCQKHGPQILDRQFRHHDGRVLTIRQSVLNALDWVVWKIENSDLNLLEFKHQNPYGIKWQVMRDGSTAYIHPDGRLANAQSPIASLEVQGIAYDALIFAAELFDELPEKTNKWRALAKKLQEKTLKLFWMEQEHFFAMAIDRDKENEPRQIKTLTSVPAELLVSTIFDSLNESKKSKYIKAITKMMYSPEFLTEAGIRSRALCHRQAVDYWDYQGSTVSWPVMTNIFALGLRKQGLISLAKDMENRMMNAARISGSLSEFFYVSSSGKVNYHPEKNNLVNTTEPEMIYCTNVPENVQAWTVSALLRIKLIEEENLCQPDNPLFLKLEEELLNQHRASCLKKEEIVNLIIDRPAFRIDKEEGRRRETALLEKYGRLA